MNQPEPERPFSEPWQAQLFAMAVHLHSQGAFTWSEWTATLSAELHQPEAAQDGSDYYHHWAAALEKLLVSSAITDSAEIDTLAQSWARAAEATPHGQEIELKNDPIR